MLEQETLRLFKGVLIDANNNQHYKLVANTLKKGYVLDPRIRNTVGLSGIIESIICTPEVNKTFFKSWEYIKNTPQETLFFHQALHYFTTYGFEALGCYDESTIYIPAGELLIPEIKSDIPFTFIKALDIDYIFDGIKTLTSGIALSEQVIKDIVAICTKIRPTDSFILNMQNKEVKARLMSLYDLVPSAPLEFLRHLVFISTGETLLIKNRKMLEKLSNADAKIIDALIPKAPSNLASIFLRFKPIFLALKKASNNKTFFNQLRRKAVKQHKPMPVDYLNEVTNTLKNGTFDYLKFIRSLEKANIYRKIRLINSLRFRSNTETNSILYKVRNGKAFSTIFDMPSDTLKALYKQVETTIMLSIVTDLNLQNKTFYIPEYVEYTLPATEKQYTGNFPSGSYISVPDDMVVGVYWKNVDGKKIDLDLSSINMEGKVGWNTNHKSENADLLFSGDITSAPNGANECFLVKSSREAEDLLMLNYYNYSEETTVPTTLFVAKSSGFKWKYMVNPNDVLMSTTFDFNKKQQILGLISSVEGERRFYFSNIGIGYNNVSGYDDYTVHAQNFISQSTQNQLTFREILKASNATIISNPIDDDFIDLSPENISKETFIKLLSGSA